MTTYHLAWEIALEAESPEHAAAQALEIQRDPLSTATLFAVFNPTGDRVTVDAAADPWTDVPGHPAEDWRAEVADGDTRLGYLAWVNDRRHCGG